MKQIIGPKMTTYKESTNIVAVERSVVKILDLLEMLGVVTAGQNHMNDKWDGIYEYISPFVERVYED